MNEGLDNIYVTTNTDAYIFVSTPKKFYSGDTRSKVTLRLGEYLFIEANYEIMNSNSKTSACQHYSNVGNDSYDFCKQMKVAKMVSENFNCTIPFVENPSLPYCRENNSEEAFHLYRNNIYAKLEDCPRPCSEIYTNFGFPDIDVNDNLEKSEAKVKLYFKTIVRVTEDFVSYDFLR